MYQKKSMHKVSIFLFTAAALASGCSKKIKDKSTSSISAKPELLRIQASNYTALWQENVSFVAENGARKTTNVSIKSLKYPIGGISLSGEPPTGQTASASGQNASAIYECTGTTNESCLVELTGEALKNLLANAPGKEMKTGTYSQINLSPCVKGGNSEAIRVKLTAEATLDGIPYFTNAATGLSTTGPAEEVTFSPRSGCGSVKFLTKNIIINADSFATQERPVQTGQTTPPPVTSGVLKEQLSLKLYFDLANAVVAIGPSTDPNADKIMVNGDFCKGKANAIDPSICINFPEIIGTVDSGTPTLTRMLINSSTIWGFYSNSNGIPFGAYQRNYYNGVYTTANEPKFLIGSMFERFQVNADNSISFQQYDDGQNRNLKVANFKLSDHTGTMTRGTSESIPYTAVKLP